MEIFFFFLTSQNEIYYHKGKKLLPSTRCAKENRTKLQTKYPEETKKTTINLYPDKQEVVATTYGNQKENRHC